MEEVDGGLDLRTLIADGSVRSVMPSEKGRDFNEVLLEEDRKAQKWMQRFTIAAPLFTAPMLLVPFHYWMGSSFIGLCCSAFYIFLIIMAEWSYYKAAFTSPGRVPASWVRLTSLFDKQILFKSI